MYSQHRLAAAKGSEKPPPPSLLHVRSQERVVKDRVIVAPVKDPYEEVLKASRRMNAGVSVFFPEREKEAFAE